MTGTYINAFLDGTEYAYGLAGMHAINAEIAQGQKWGELRAKNQLLGNIRYFLRELAKTQNSKTDRTTLTCVPDDQVNKLGYMVNKLSCCNEDMEQTIRRTYPFRNLLTPQGFYLLNPQGQYILIP